MKPGKLQLKKVITLPSLRPVLAATFLLTALEFGASATQPNPPGFWKSRLPDIDAAVKEVKQAQVRVLTKSAGGRNIYLVTYGEKQNWYMPHSNRVARRRSRRG
jgi:hypothetical protein